MHTYTCTYTYTHTIESLLQDFESKYDKDVSHWKTKYSNELKETAKLKIENEILEKKIEGMLYVYVYVRLHTHTHTYTEVSTWNWFPQWNHDTHTHTHTHTLSLSHTHTHTQQHITHTPHNTHIHTYIHIQRSRLGTCLFN